MAEDKRDPAALEADGSYSRFEEEAREMGLPASDIRLAVDTMKVLRGEEVRK